MGEFKNEKDDDIAVKVGAVVISVITVFIGELFNNNIWAYIIPFTIGFVFGLPYFKYLIRKEKADKYRLIRKERIEQRKRELFEQQKYYNQNEILDKIDFMTGQEFETFLIEKLLPYDGYTNINGTAYSGDYGVDIIAEKKGLKCAIQCKRFENKVSPRAIQEVVAGRKHYKCDKAIVITNNYYTNNAKQLAYDNKVELLDRDYIIQMIKLVFNHNDFNNIVKYNSNSKVSKQFAETVAYNNPKTIEDIVKNTYPNLLQEIGEVRKIYDYDLKTAKSLVDKTYKKIDEKLENEMEAYGLEEHEKELVRKEEYNPWDFETEEPFEDDDYYNDDV